MQFYTDDLNLSKPEKTNLGICTFNDKEVVTMYSLAVVFDTLYERLPKREKVGGKPNMAFGVEEALRILGGKDGEIVVIVNDVDRSEAGINNLLSKLKTKNVIIHVIALGPNGANQGKLLAQATGGKFLFTPAAPVPKERIIVGLQDAFMKQFEDLEDEVVTVLSGHYTLRGGKGADLHIPFNMENSAGNDINDLAR